MLSNLLGNAVKFTPDGGKISVATKITGKNIQVAVSDNGCGIPKAEQTHIFEKFSQLTNLQRQGLGLGLYISKWIADEHGGAIAVESAPNDGSTFTLTLPAL